MKVNSQNLRDSQANPNCYSASRPYNHPARIPFVRESPRGAAFFCKELNMASLRFCLVDSDIFGLVPKRNWQILHSMSSHSRTSDGEPPTQSRHLARIAFNGDRPGTLLPNRSGHIGHDFSDWQSSISFGWSRQHQRHFWRIASSGVIVLSFLRCFSCAHDKLPCAVPCGQLQKRKYLKKKVCG